MGSEDFKWLQEGLGFVRGYYDRHPDEDGGEMEQDPDCFCARCVAVRGLGALANIEREHTELAAALVQLQQERDSLRGEVLGLQRMLEEALKPGFHASACPWCARPLTARGVTLHLPHCRKRPEGVGHA